MNRRPKSEDPLELVRERPRLLAGNGYRWVRGLSGLEKPSEGLFLMANAGPKGDRAITPPRDLYLELAQLSINEEHTLTFANRFGELGVKREHFHSEERRRAGEFGESAGYWGMTISQFQFWFKIWCAIEDGNLHELEKLLPIQDESLRTLAQKDPVKRARSHLIDEINRELRPSFLLRPTQGCFVPSCRFNRRPLPSFETAPPQYIAYQLGEAPTRGRPKIEAHVSSTCLLVTAWLQFAELVCGGRKIRPCEVCGTWMDISETARPGSKRMHDRCSLAQRMRRYRSKSNDAEEIS